MGLSLTDPSTGVCIFAAGSSPRCDRRERERERSSRFRHVFKQRFSCLPETGTAF